MFNYEIPLWEIAILNAKHYKKINLNTIFNLNAKTIKKILNDERPWLSEQYSRYMIKKWIKNNEVESFRFINLLKKIIKKLKIEMKELDTEYIWNMEERIFTKNRTIKNLESDIDLNKKEYMLAFFLNGEIYESKNNWWELKYKSLLIISNQRFLFKPKTPTEKSPKIIFSNIKKYEFNEQGCLIITKNNVKYLLRIHNSKTLNLTINKIFKKRVKNVYQERKDN